MKRFLAAFALCLCLSPIAMAGGAFRDDLPKISWEKAAEHYGQECIVYGAVVATRDIGNRCFLNFHQNYRENFTVVINKNVYDKFPENPESYFRGKNVRVVGKVVEFKGKPEIVVDSADVIEVVDSPNPPEGSDVVTTKLPDTTATTTTTPQDASAHNDIAPPPAAANGTVRIATFNVLNLFDEFDDPYVENERLPGKDADEIGKIAATIAKLGADVVALEEVENRQVVEKMCHDHLAKFGYEVVEFEGNSDRGIDVALLSRLPIGSVTSHRHLDFVDGNGNPMRFQRDLLQVEIEPDGLEPFDVFVVHLKSKYGGAEKSLPLRMGEANTIRKLFDDMLSQDSRKRFVICGDFNDTFDSEPLKRIVGTGDKALHAFFEDVPEDQRITYNRNHLSMIDFILASPAMAKTYVPKSYTILPGSVESGGSDHNPVAASFHLSAMSASN
ncbi:MAG: endonuclease/exonuclease/phosphatase family protein [Phycisphaerales bacterium]|nr:endonuclease/exonuclease/phosphatase family protein [Phycisphaerales bacterium]